MEWKPVEVLTGTFKALDVEFEKLVYASAPPSKLLKQDIFSTQVRMLCRPQEVDGGRLI